MNKEEHISVDKSLQNTKEKKSWSKPNLKCLHVSNTQYKPIPGGDGPDDPYSDS